MRRPARRPPASGPPGRPARGRRASRSPRRRRSTGPWRSASTSRPRPWRSEPSKRDWRPADAGRADGGVGPGPARARRTVDATGQPGTSGSRARQTVAPRSSIAWFQAQPWPAGTSGVGRGLGLGGRRPAARPGGPGPGPRWCRPRPTSRSPGEGQHGPRRVGPDAGQGQQGVEVARAGGRRARRPRRRRSGAGSRPGGCSRGRPTASTTSPTGAAAQLAAVGEAVQERVRTWARPGPPGSAGASARDTSTAHGSRVRRHGRSRRVVVPPGEERRGGGQRRRHQNTSVT